MAKKTGGKVATKENEKVTDVQMEENEVKEQKKSDTVYLNNVSSKMIHEVVDKNGKSWRAVNFSAMVDGKQEMCSVLVRPGQVLESTKFGKDGEKVPNDGFNNVLLGSPTQNLNVKIKDKLPNGEYDDKSIQLTTVAVKEGFEAARAAYKAKKKEEQQARDGVEVAAEAEVQEAQMGE